MFARSGQGTMCNISAMYVAVCIVGYFSVTHAQFGRNTVAQNFDSSTLFDEDILQLRIDPPDATCGLKGAEMICDVDNPTQCFECTAALPDNSYPPEYMLDRDLQSAWQSTYWESYPAPFDVKITMSLRKQYQFENDILLSFPNDHFPSQMTLEKSLDFGITWEVFQYYSTNCMEDFGLPTTDPNKITETTQVICSDPTIYRNTGFLKYELFPRYRLLAGEDGSFVSQLNKLYEEDVTFHNFFSFTDLRLHLMRPYKGEDLVGQEPITSSRYHYSIAYIFFGASCFCNLHGSFCFVDDADNVVCSCGHKTEGGACHRCQHGYRGTRWKPGSFFPFPDGSANECIETPPTTEAPTTFKTTAMMTTHVTELITEMVTEPPPGPPQGDPAVCLQDPDPCNDNGMCTPVYSALGFECDCFPGYLGYRCDKYNDPCSSKPCPPSQPHCRSYGGVTFDCLTRDEYFNITMPTFPPDILELGTIATIALGTASIPLFCVFLILLCYCFTWRHLHPKAPYGSEYIENFGTGYFDNYFATGPSSVYSNAENPKYGHLRDRWVVLSERLNMGKILFSGEFSYISEGTLIRDKLDKEGAKVAIKMVKDPTDKLSDDELKTEFEVLGNIGRHPNIIFLMGICYKLIEERRQMCLVLQYVSRGDMLRILRRCRSRRRDQGPLESLPVHELLSFAMDVAKGMRHMSTYKFVHQALCARNVVITFNNRAKICDFASSTVVRHVNEYIPFLQPRKVYMRRWMPYEAIVHGKFCLKSDVWSYGVVVWEIVTLGGIPYHTVKDEDLTKAIANHERMDWPRHISQELNDVLLRCWHRSPESRPNFDLLYKEMKQFLKHAKKQIKLQDYPFNVYVPLKPPDTNWEKMQDAFV